MSQNIVEPFSPLNPQHVEFPDAHMAAARQMCPVSKQRDGLYLLSKDHDAREVLGDVKHYSNRGNWTFDRDLELDAANITLLDPPEHTVMRKRLFKNFAPGKLKELIPLVQNIVNMAIEDIADKKELDVYADYFHRIPAQIVFAQLGLPEKDWMELQDWADIIFETVPEPVDDLPETAKMFAYLREIVRQRRASGSSGSNDILDNLCFAEAGEVSYTDEEIVGQMFQLTSAATDSTRSLMANLTWRLLEQPKRWDEVVADRSLLTNAIEESLRFDSPFQFVIRKAKEEIEVHGCPVPAGSKLIVSLQSANHDEDVWGEDSMKFDLHRKGASAHLAFGRGAHTCLGALLGKLEAEIAVSALLDRFPAMRLAPDAKWQKCDSSFFRRPVAIPVCLNR